MIKVSGFNRRYIMKTSTGLILIFVCIAVVMAAGCMSGAIKNTVSPTPTPKITAVVTDEPVTTFVKVTRSNGYLVIDISNKGSIYRDYSAIVTFYDGDVKLNTAGTHFSRAEPGETVRGKLYIPNDARGNYDLDIGETIAGRNYKTHYTMI